MRPESNPARSAPLSVPHQDVSVAHLLPLTCKIQLALPIGQRSGAAVHALDQVLVHQVDYDCERAGGEQSTLLLSTGSSTPASRQHPSDQLPEARPFHPLD